MWLLYQLGFALLLLAALPLLLLRRGAHHLRILPKRLGKGSPAPRRPPLWLHAVSVGEAGVAATLARSLPADLPLLVTTVTPTGRRRAGELLGDRAVVDYLPIDLAFAVNRFLDRHRPLALVIVEGDLWPLLLRCAKRRGLPVAVVNGRISDRNFRRLKRLRPLLAPLLGPVDLFAVQSPTDEMRLLELGVAADRIRVTGNLKFDASPGGLDGDLESLVRSSAGGRPVLIAGSTMAGEEGVVLDAFQRIGGERALLILAPRHPERCDEVAATVGRRGLRMARRSRPAEAGGEIDVLLLDSLGELAGLYRLAAAVFIGGTLVPTGGHNPLEPACFGVPIAAGPSMHNFREVEREFDRLQAWGRVGHAEELAALWARWLQDAEAAARLGARAAEVVESNRGALQRTLVALEPLLPPAPAASHPQEGAR